MFLKIRFVQKQKSLFSVDKTSSKTAQEPRATTQKIGGFGKKEQHTQRKMGLDIKIPSYFAVRTERMKT